MSKEAQKGGKEGKRGEGKRDDRNKIIRESKLVKTVIKVK